MQVAFSRSQIHTTLLELHLQQLAAGGLKLFQIRLELRLDIAAEQWLGAAGVERQQNLFPGKRFSLSANDVCQRAQRTVHGFGVGEDFGHVRFQNHNVRATMVTPDIFAPDAAGEIVFHPQFRIR